MRLTWDKAGERRYETGVDRGVLYLPNGTAVPWNGLTSIDESTSDAETTEYYFDGVKYNNRRYPGDFSATLKALTYPDEFEEFDGLGTIQNGMQLSNQPVQNTFALSYRTKVGNDVNGLNHGYKIHIIYNITASPDDRSYSSLGSQNAPLEFSWKLSAIPEHVPGFRPTAHVVLDTRKLNKYLVADLENLLYGKDPEVADFDKDILDGGDMGIEITDELFDGGTPDSSGTELFDGGTPYSTVTISDSNSDTGVSLIQDIDGGSAAAPGGKDEVNGGNPLTSAADAGDDIDIFVPTPPARLPSMADLVDLVQKWSLIEIVDNGDGTWTAIGPDDFIKMLDPTSFEITGVDATYTSVNTYTVSSTHGF